MAKRISEESRAVNYFQYHANLETVRAVLGICTGIVKQRLAAESGEQTRSVTKKRKTKRTNSVGVLGTGVRTSDAVEGDL